MHQRSALFANRPQIAPIRRERHIIYHTQRSLSWMSAFQAVALVKKAWLARWLFTEKFQQIISKDQYWALFINRGQSILKPPPNRRLACPGFSRRFVNGVRTMDSDCPPPWHAPPLHRSFSPDRTLISDDLRSANYQGRPGRKEQLARFE